MRRIVRTLGWTIATLLLLAVVAGFAYRSLTLPQVDGKHTLPGLSGPVDVVRDAAGVPHLYAAHTDDVWFALGYVHAQDRLWQMELNRRTAAGRLSEVLGAGAVDTDRFLRALGVARNAAAVVAHLDDTTRHALERYAAGVNANLDERRAKPRALLPIEFVITGAPFPEPWTPADSAGWTTMMAWDLSTNWSAELARLRFSQRLTKQQIDELMPPYPGNPRIDADGHVTPAVPDAPLDIADYPALYRRLKIDTQALATDAATLMARAPTGWFDGIGSNNWVVSGARTTSGKPLLANDPHLGLSVPSLWYLAHLSSPDLDVIGATLPGIPFVVIGRNRRIGWGLTNTGPDTQDLYIEELREHDGVTEARTPDGWQPVETRDEVIHVKGAADVPLRVRSSRHGPLMSDVSRSMASGVGALGSRYALAFQWAALRPDDQSMAAGFALGKASDWTTFVEALKHWDAPQQNFVYGDVDGNIGFIAPGRVPVRRPDNDLKGQVPSPGWDARYDWDGWVPFDKLPMKLNPSEGRIVTANHRVVDDDGGPFLTSEWAAPFRARRIETLLDARPLQDVASFAAIQGDVRSLAAVALLPLLTDTTPTNDGAKDAIARLAAWDGTMRGDRVEPLIFSTWMRELVRLVTKDELGDALFAGAWEQRTVFLINVLSNRDGQSRWCDDIDTPVVETCATMKTRALDLALADLSKRLGPDRTRWRWDALHVVRAEHRPFSRVPELARFFDLAAPIGGDGNTVDVAAFRIGDEAEPFVSHHGPSLRQIVDFDDLERSRFIQSSGQSGNRLSSRYGDLFDRWRAVESLPMQMDRSTVTSGAIGTLNLVP